MELRSQELRKIAPELDPLRLGTGWKVEDLSKPQIMIESTFGDSHPGSGHLLELVEEAREGIAEAGGHGARYFTTDICDGEAQGHDGINYSLASRDMIANMIEIHANATPFDGAVFVASCDKGMPAHLMGVGRVNIPSIVVTGGVMDAGPDLLTLEQIGKYSAMCERGEITEEKLTYYKQHACPSCGACSFMGTASTMQIMAEALGLMLPGSALMPATSPDLRKVAKEAGKQAVWLAEHNLTPDKIVTMKSFENAIMVHAAISGSTNSLLHLPAIAREFGIEIDGDTFDRLHRGAHYLLNILHQREIYNLPSAFHMHQRSGTGDDFVPDFDMFLIIRYDRQILANQIQNSSLDLFQIKSRLVCIINHKSMLNTGTGRTGTLNIPDAVPKQILRAVGHFPVNQRLKNNVRNVSRQRSKKRRSCDNHFFPDSNEQVRISF